MHLSVFIALIKIETPRLSFVPYEIDDDPRNITRMIAGLNTNIPVERRTLIDYIEHGNFFYKTKTGDRIDFPKYGIDYLASIADNSEKLTLRLPLFVSTDSQSETSMWKIDGRTEVAVVSKILERKNHSEDRLPIYYPDLVKLRKLLPDLICILFV